MNLFSFSEVMCFYVLISCLDNMQYPTLLIIFDGYGIAGPGKYNAITLAKKPTIDKLFEMYPSTSLGATGLDVGLEKNKMSGSEAGHMNIGAGRIVIQDSNIITKSIGDSSFFRNPALIGAINHIKKFGGKLHIMGLMGDGDSPHSEPGHFRAVLKLAKKNGIRDAYCHLFTDGRDSFPKSALTHLSRFKKIMREEAIGKIATLSGRYYAMDRTKNWERLTLAYDAMVFSRGKKAGTAEEAILNNYKKNLTDEFLLPSCILESGKPIAKISKNDAVIFFNLRSDRARQFSKLFVAMNKNKILIDDMPIIDKIENLHFVALTDFGPDLNIFTAYPERSISAALPMALSGMKQLYIAETEKYAHITYFLNGGYADPVGGEDRVIIPSPTVKSYAAVPEMSAKKITDHVLKKIKKNAYDFYAINFANADMVGHTGDLGATVLAIEALDNQIKSMSKEILKRGGNIIITADHGNAEIMYDEKEHQPNTFHTKNPVPFLLVGEKFKGTALKSNGILGNIAPTILEILGIEKPKAMDKGSLLD
jgi:2,3-bisphosphoglycerate-independent phosphoglycerate mutase